MVTDLTSTPSLNEGHPDGSPLEDHTADQSSASKPVVFSNWDEDPNQCIEVQVMRDDFQLEGLYFIGSDQFSGRAGEVQVTQEGNGLQRIAIDLDGGGPSDEGQEVEFYIETARPVDESMVKLVQQDSFSTL
ncbi:hypothetical protein [Rhodoligotrophos defluvii]|uniref:hypothetical protein n=1 Tax=Rhodoligotrophos defluvii TaxID=2561934 RepID=UPI0010C9B91D|nr:hypothetical protein [Rhodoligotrophos defluvii]